MNNELVKKLSDAGFKGLKGRSTLIELIEACIGDKPNSFYLEFNDEWAVYEEPNKEGKWKCRYYDRTPVGFYEIFGDTPEEAVAELWLVLNK